LHFDCPVSGGKKRYAGLINLKALAELIPYWLRHMPIAQFLGLQTALRLF